MNKDNIIPCEWREIYEFLYSKKGQPKKKARYHGSIFSKVKGFGSKRWVVCGYLDVDYVPYLEEGLSEEEIARRCIEHLNKPPARKKYQKKIGRVNVCVFDNAAIKLFPRGGNRFFHLLVRGFRFFSWEHSFQS